MKLKFQHLFALASVMLAAGCGSYEPVQFISEAKPPAFATGTTNAASNLSKADEKKIQLAVYSYLLGREQPEAGTCSALFAQADDDVVDALIKKFPNHVPPIKQSKNLDLGSGKAPLDKETGKPVMILGADVGEPNAEGTVEVVGRWYAGNDVKGVSMFSLRKTGDDWPILSVR